MTAGGSALWFDLFVAMVEHMVSLLSAQRAWLSRRSTDCKLGRYLCFEGQALM
jgi:uncharacterized protein YecT (DUF1311 family)